MEYLDVLDKNGQPTGRKMSRAEIHKNGEFHLAAHVWIINSKKELLLQLRSKDKEAHPNMWDISCAGHVSAGQTSKEATVREVEEELGVTINPEELKFLFRYSLRKVLREDYINNGFFDVYIMHKDLPVSGFSFKDNEVSAVKYFPYLKIKKIIENKHPEFVLHTEEYHRLFKYLASNN